MGGPWEKKIRSVRKFLRALLKEEVVCDEVLSTVLTKAANILNSRLLTRSSDDPMDDDLLHQIIFCNCDHVLACPLESLRRRICIAHDSGDKRST